MSLKRTAISFGTVFLMITFGKNETEAVCCHRNCSEGADRGEASCNVFGCNCAMNDNPEVAAECYAKEICDRNYDKIDDDMRSSAIRTRLDRSNTMPGYNIEGLGQISVNTIDVNIVYFLCNHYFQGKTYNILGVIKQYLNT